MNKRIFLERLQKERDAFEILLNKAGFSRRMTMNGVLGNLSIKDLLVDILVREQFIADRLAEIIHGGAYAPAASNHAFFEFEETYGYPDYESPLYQKGQIDHLTIYKHKNIGVDEIVAQELSAFANIVSCLEKITHEQCLDFDLYHRIAEQTYRPYRRTSLEIRRWLKSIKAES
ncbi:MAG: hypothetical protein IT311_13235 [Anaerolineales bacterium]|nr:hypothetical protein [Anaerolineales bacterium]MCZ2121799.1 hypothetical protein [Anaerolineales bacterium]